MPGKRGSRAKSELREKLKRLKKECSAEGRNLTELRVFGGKFIGFEFSPPVRLAKIVFDNGLNGAVLNADNLGGFQRKRGR